MAKIGVIIKEPGRLPRHVNISDTLENLQKTVGGYIETVTLCSDIVLICDEEGRIKGKPHCCNIGAWISAARSFWQVLTGMNSRTFRAGFRTLSGCFRSFPSARHRWYRL